MQCGYAILQAILVQFMRLGEHPYVQGLGLSNIDQGLNHKAEPMVEPHITLGLGLRFRGLAELGCNT